jgi:hypothetical protein
MRWLAYTAVVFLLPLSAWAEEKTKPNTLTPKEIADGWILLFDGTTKFGWKVEGDAKVKDGVFTLGGEKAATAKTTCPFGDYELRLEFRKKGTKNDLKICGMTVVTPPLGLGKDDWIETTLKLEGMAFELSAKSGRSGVGAGGSREKQGPAPVIFEAAEKDKFLIRNIKLKPLGLKSIFNGKDLTGWKEVKTNRTKSKFTVTNKGELNIKNGPGDIQTEGQWADFALQIEVFSNGPHLNSGVFFRSIPGKFWAGYEAQIRNEWVSDVLLKDGTKLTGSYNPKTEEVSVRTGRRVKKVKVKKADIKEIIDHRDKPIDFGTGAIYNRQAARKVVSSDHEWFTMTIVANGNHLAVWVNGYQTADFTDKRKANDNARNGAKTGKGAISLQGHDPTTDLRFRNIRIAELSKEKK